MQCHYACLVATMHGDRLVSVEPARSSRESDRRCQLYEGMDPRPVCVEHGWWFPEDAGAEPSLHGVWTSNCNVLTDDDPDICNPSAEATRCGRCSAGLRG